MSNIEFYNVRGKTSESVEASYSSLHHQRSIVVIDDNNMIIWIINGSRASKKKIEFAQKFAEERNEEKGSAHHIQLLDYKDKDQVKDILDGKDFSDLHPETKKGKKAKKSRKFKTNADQPIPKVPIIETKSKREKRARDREEKKHKVSEFQIEYYEDDSELSSKSQLELVSMLLQEIHKAQNHIISRKQAKKHISELVDAMLRDI